MSDTNTFCPVFKGNLILKGKIECRTGLHIGGSKEKLEIGGVDSPVIRNPRTRMPYIPGSSLKGKMRHLLEFGLGVVSEGAKLGDVSHDVKIVRLFGIGANETSQEKQTALEKKLSKIGPSRLIVRDCQPDKKTTEMWKTLDSELLYTEYKPENTINRVTAAANPRFIERVTEGSKFDFEMIYADYQIQEKEGEDLVKNDLRNLLKAMRMLEHNFLGKSGSRGYGQIRFWLKQPFWVMSDEYINGGENYKKSIEPAAESDLMSLDAIDLAADLAGN